MYRAFICLLFLSSCSYFEITTSEDIEPFEMAIEQPLPVKPDMEVKEQTEVHSQELPLVEPVHNQSLKAFPRTVIALWSSKAVNAFDNTSVFRCMEFPLNVLGYKVEYVDIESGFPDLEVRDDVIGIISWFPSTFVMTQIDAYLRWSVKQVDEGKKFIIVGSVTELSKQGEAPLIDELWNRLGVAAPNDWAIFTYDYKIAYQDPSLYPFERKVPVILPQFLTFQILPGEAKSLLTLQSRSQPGVEITTATINKNGALISEAYLLYQDPNLVFQDPKWLLNPFILFRRIFDAPQFPIPDPTTLAGRRVYYSQIDGDGWNNISLTKKQESTRPLYSSEVILNQVIKQSPDLPVTVAPIAAEIDLKWFGTEKSREIAKEFFALPQVEVGSHTFTHPFDWSFFENYTEAKELPFLDRYPNKTFQVSPLEFLKNFKIKPSSYYSLNEGETSGSLQKGYVIPRAYALEPFSAEQEVLGAIDVVNQIAPDHKKVELYQWSGNGEAFQRVIDLTVEAGVQNINGASNRYDFLNASYNNLYPYCTTLSTVHQVFNSNSNENEYTNLWTTNYFAFATVTNTFDWTESPIRVKPIDHYYHMYSGERQASLSALKRNLEYIRRQKICPIHASDFSKSVLGFASTELLRAEENVWLIANRGALQTLRFDRAVFQGVDFNKSKGVIGQKHLHGSLYIALDSEEDNPIVALKELDEGFTEPREPLYYLLESRWNTFDLQQEAPKKAIFKTQGFGEGEMIWIVPEDGLYEIVFRNDAGNELHKSIIQASEQRLLFNIPLDALYTLNGSISLLEASDE